MSTSAVVTISVTVLLAVTGYFATYLNNLRLARRKDRLDRVSKQLSDFYGPLLALSHAATESWKAFMWRYRPPEARWFLDVEKAPPPTEEELAVYRLWIRHVLVPLDIRMVDVVTGKADLLEESEVPECLLQLIAHVTSWQAVLRQWDDKDFTEIHPIIRYPSSDVDEYAKAHFRRLKSEQNRLLGVSPPIIVGGDGREG